MHILIIGAAGMIGRKLTDRLVRDGALADRAIARAVLHDVTPPHAPPDAPFPIEALSGDLSAPGEAERLIATRPDVIFHLAAVVSGEAEQDFDLGYRVNLDATRLLFEALRKAGQTPKLVFSSSIAVFGAPFPEEIPDDFHHTPLTSYGAQKAMGELLLNDYSRRGLIDGIGVRLPTITVRPGKPNKAASGFFSGILREPLAGQEAICPVSTDVRHWMASPRSAVGFLLHAAALDGSQLGARRSLTMPGIAATVADMIAALDRVAGPQTVARIRFERDPFIEKIVAGWPRAFKADRARDLGFTSETIFDDIIRVHIEDELNGRLPT